MRWIKEQALIKWLWTWVWWALEQFSVLFLPKSAWIDGEEIPPCPTCWWYRGVILGLTLGVVVTLLVK